jgi:hypothetical protein
MRFKDQLEGLGACKEAVEWVGDRDLTTAWEECVRGDWMLWLAARLKVGRKLVALAACDCAEPSLKFLREDEGRPAAALGCVRAWCVGEATLTEVKVAASEAADASYTADTSADAAGAAYAAAAYAAYAGASYAALSAADAAYADAAGAAGLLPGPADALGISLARSADLVRKRISAEILLEVSDANTTG